jgi:hypothetical protein
MKTRNSACILFAVICFGIAILLGCDQHSRLLNAAKPVGEVQPLFTPEAASLEQQKMCSEQAAKRFREQTGGNITISHDISRYDPSVNVCYVRVYYASGDTVVDTVYDAFGGRVYASYGLTGSHVDVPTMCKIFIPGKPVQFCKSTSEFNELVERYFGVTQ